MFRDILDIHFCPDRGTPYWIDLLRQKGLCRDDIRSLKDLALLGAMDVSAMRSRPLDDFIPRSLASRIPEMILAETGGSTGDPCRRVYLPDEFHSAFVAPWLRAVERFQFPHQQHWLFIGPSGPHVIAQAARSFARATRSMEPFSIDCDVRWVKRQQDGSMGSLLYMDHLMEQAMNIIMCQDITVLFTTPPLLLALAEEMSARQRSRIRGIHTGGMAQDAATGRKLAALFPAAVILPGYGNSLFGVAFERRQVAGESSVFFSDDPALSLHFLPLAGDGGAAAVIPQKDVAAGERGRLMFHRFDRSYLLVNMLERDTAVTVLQDGEYGFSDIAAFSSGKQRSGGVY